MTNCTILQIPDITGALTRISHEILESNRGGENLVVLGIPTRGVVLAQRIRADFVGKNIPTSADE